MTPTSQELSSTSHDELVAGLETCISLLHDEERTDSNAGKQSLSPPDDQLSVSIVRITRNERWTIRRGIEKWLRTTRPFGARLLVVDHGSTDGTREVLRELAERDSRLVVYERSEFAEDNGWLEEISPLLQSDITLLTPLASEIDPDDVRKLAEPIVSAEADAVVGIRSPGRGRPVSRLTESLGRSAAAIATSLVWNRSLADVTSGCVAVRTELLNQLRLESGAPGAHAELLCRLIQSGARLSEVAMRTVDASEGRKRPSAWRETLSALWQVVRCRWFDTRFTSHTGLHTLRSVDRAQTYNRWLLAQCQEWLGDRLLEAGSGIGNLSQSLLDRQRLVLVDYDREYIQRLENRFQQWENTRVVQADLTDNQVANLWRDEQLDTVFCSNVLEHLEPDVQVLKSFHDSLDLDGHCVIIVPAEPVLFTGLDSDLGHYRRYTQSELRSKFEEAGFEVVHTQQFNRLGSVGWYVNGKLLGRREISPRQMILFDQLWPWAQYLDHVLPVPGMSLLMVGRRVSV